MLLAKVTEAGKALELRWMWLPTFISQNYALMGEMSKAWESEHPNGIPSSPGVEETAHKWAIEWLDKKLKIRGLSSYLRGIEYVEEQS